jgi:hypothetical protein
VSKPDDSKRFVIPAARSDIELSRGNRTRVPEVPFFSSCHRTRNIKFDEAEIFFTPAAAYMLPARFSDQESYLLTH